MHLKTLLYLVALSLFLSPHNGNATNGQNETPNQLVKQQHSYQTGKSKLNLEAVLSVGASKAAAGNFQGAYEDFNKVIPELQFHQPQHYEAYFQPMLQTFRELARSCYPLDQSAIDESSAVKQILIHRSLYEAVIDLAGLPSPSKDYKYLALLEEELIKLSDDRLLILKSLLFNTANYYLQAGDQESLERAKMHLERANELNDIDLPLEIEVNYLLGILLSEIGTPQEGKSHLKFASHYNHIVATVNLAKLYFEQAKLKKAEDCWRQAAEQEGGPTEFLPAKYQAQYSLGMLLKIEGRMLEASHYLQLAAENNHEDANFEIATSALSHF